MILSVDNVLTPEELDFVTSRLDTTDFVDGKTTAGWHARSVKHNSQLTSKASYAKELTDLVKNAFLRSSLFQIALQPKVIHSMLFSRYEAGMSYGSHVDNALMGNQEFWRSDISLTLFLSEREILFELDTARRSIFHKDGKTTEFDLISKSHANLLRKWADL